MNAYWHPWHLGGPLWFLTPDQVAARRQLIAAHKPEAERPERLRLFVEADVSSLPKLVKARAAYVKAGAAYVEARAAYDKAWDAYVKAGAARDEAWAARDEAGAARDEASAALVKAGAARDKASAAYDEALRDAMPEIVALHAAQCGCRWTPEHPNIFEDERL